MLIYLDTSQLSELTKLQDIDKIFLDVFFKQWNEKSVVLCLSLQHLHEIAQLKDKHSREKRLSILQNFKNFRFIPLGWCSIIRREAIAQMLNHMSKKNYDPIQLFKENMWKQTNAEFLLNYVEQNLETLLKSRKIYEAASDIEEIFKPVKKLFGNYFKGRFKSLEATIPDNLEEAKKIIKQLKSTDETAGLSDIFIEKIFKAVEETGSLSSALIKLLKLEGLSDIEKRYLSDAGSLAAFYKLARKAVPYVAKITGVLETEVSQYIEKINLASCPGFSLRTALLRAFRSSDKKIVPSDWMDANHIVYAPYVDIFFADKRTYDYLCEETRNQPFRIEKSLISNIRCVVPLDKLF